MVFFCGELFVYIGLFFFLIPSVIDFPGHGAVKYCLNKALEDVATQYTFRHWFYAQSLLPYQQIGKLREIFTPLEVVFTLVSTDGLSGLYSWQLGM